MNDEARRHMEGALSGLQEAKQCLSKASGKAENGTIRERIEREISHIENCLQDCEGIASGLAQK